MLSFNYLSSRWGLVMPLQKLKKARHEQADASPAKEFFIRMITRDIDLDDCILDLLDNSLDGAKRVRNSAPAAELTSKEFARLYIKIIMSKQRFSIVDNCGGISIDDAKNYAFHFGRRSDEQRDAPESIGIYGIGMKRAMFKIGTNIKICSSTTKESFEVDINVPVWEKDPKWKFDLEPGRPLKKAGTEIAITGPPPPVAADLADVAFANRLRETIARDYTTTTTASPSSLRLVLLPHSRTRTTK
jgi:hypothetical protein